MNKRIAILGSTGSIGTSALEVIAHLGLPYQVAALSAHSRVERLVEQVRLYRPAAVAIGEECKQAEEIRRLGAEVYVGAAGVQQLSKRADVDIVLGAIVGAAGLGGASAAVEAGKTLALANKESLVVGGSLLIPLARRTGARIIPVDSEHSAVFQAMACGKLSEVQRVVLTASGGPFRNWTAERMRSATVADALNHPTWRMGSKISIDSATMFNKALEIIEACWLFGLPPEKVEVVVHPESVVHSLVEFVDGSVMAQLSPPDMRTPIQYALTYPDRKVGIGRRLDLSAGFSMNFEPPDIERFPSLRLGYEAARAGGTMGAVLNAANEAAVSAFASGKIGFMEITSLVEDTMRAHRLQAAPTLDDLMKADEWARRAVEGKIAK